MEQNEKWKLFKLMRLSIPYLNVTYDPHNVVLKASTVQPFPFLRNHTAFINMSALWKETHLLSNKIHSKHSQQVYARFVILPRISKHRCMLRVMYIFLTTHTITKKIYKEESRRKKRKNTQCHAPFKGAI